MVAKSRADYWDDLDAAIDEDRAAPLIGLTRDQIGGGGDLIGQRRHSGHERSAEKVRLSAAIDQGRQASHANGRAHRAQAKRTPHGVADDHADVCAGSLAEPGAQALCASVGILGQEQHPGPAAGCCAGRLRVALVDPRVGRDEAQPVAHDQRVARRPRDGRALAQDELDQAGILLDLPGQLLRPRRRGHGREVHVAALGARQELGHHDDDVAIRERAARARQPVREQAGEIVARRHHGQARQRGQRQVRRAHRGHGATCGPACAGSPVMRSPQPLVW